MLVEAKLWRNPEARRTAVAQALDYASAVFRMSYSELEAAVLKARAAAKESRESLYEIVAAGSAGIGENERGDRSDLKRSVSGWRMRGKGCARSRPIRSAARYRGGFWRGERRRRAG